MKVFLLFAILLIATVYRSKQTPVCNAPPNDENLQACCDVPTLTEDPNYAHCLSQYGYEGHIPNNVRKSDQILPLESSPNNNESILVRRGLFHERDKDPS